MRLILTLALLAIAAPALGDAPAVAGSLETRTCLNNRDIRAKRLSPTQGYFAQTSHGWWHNIAGACSAYAADRALTTNSTENRQCRGDVVNVFEPISHISFGTCVLGGWEKIGGEPDVPSK